jgi:hypothetical protein
MREYGQIQCGFWQRVSEEGWSNDAALLGAYLLTGPHSNGVGCYRLPSGYVCDDLGWTLERVTQTLSELSEKGFCNRFGTVVLIPKFLRWNGISNGNVAKAREQEFEAIPNDQAKEAAALALLTFGNHWTDGFRNRLETLSKGYGKQNPTQTKPKEEAKAPPPATADFKAELFTRWKSLPDGGGGAFLNKLFKDHKPEQRVIEAVERTLDDTRADPKAFVLGVLNQQAAAETREADLWRTVQ